MTHTRLSCIALSNEIQGGLVKLHLSLFQAVFRKGLGNQVLLGNLHFFLINVSRQGNDFRSVQKWLWNGVQGIGSENKENVRHVKGQVQIIISERNILLWIQHLQQGTGWVSLVAHTHFIHLVNQEHGTSAFNYLQSLYNFTWHGPHVGSTMALDFSLIPHSTYGKTEEGLVHGTSNGMAHAGFTHSRRSHQDNDGALVILFQFADGKIFKNAFFHILQPIMILLEHLLGLLHVIAYRWSFLVSLGPWQSGNGFQIITHHIVFRGAAFHQLEFF